MLYPGKIKRGNIGLPPHLFIELWSLINKTLPVLRDRAACGLFAIEDISLCPTADSRGGREKFFDQIQRVKRKKKWQSKSNVWCRGGVVRFGSVFVVSCIYACMKHVMVSLTSRTSMYVQTSVPPFFFWLLKSKWPSVLPSNSLPFIPSPFRITSWTIVFTYFVYLKRWNVEQYTQEPWKKM